jgi:hypothetical protein
MISEEAYPGWTTVYRGTVASLGHDMRVLEEMLPMWLLEYLLMNKPPPVPVVKLSFVLLPWPSRSPDEEQLPELLDVSVISSLEFPIFVSPSDCSSLRLERNQNSQLAVSSGFARWLFMYVLLNFLCECKNSLVTGTRYRRSWTRLHEVLRDLVHLGARVPLNCPLPTRPLGQDQRIFTRFCATTYCFRWTSRWRP